MIPFQKLNKFEFLCEIDFGISEIANLFFHSSDHNIIPFHLSLRPNRSAIVLNSNHGKGWNKEFAISHEFSQDDLRLTLEVNDNAVRILIDESLVHCVNTTDFPHFEAIAYARFDGAVIKESVRICGESGEILMGLAELKVVAPCLITGWAFVPGYENQSYHIKVDGLEETFRVECLSSRSSDTHYLDESQKYQIRALIPGWVWLGMGGYNNVCLQVYSNGIECGDKIILSKTTLANLLEAFASDADYRNSTRYTLAAIEHLRFASISKLLSREANSFFKEAAALYKVTSFLASDSGLDNHPEFDPSFKLPEVSPADLLHSRARELFMQIMRGNTSADSGEALEYVLSSILPLGEVRIRFFLEFSEYFCARDEFAVLYAQMSVAERTHFLPGEGGWYNSAILPFLLYQGKIREIYELIEQFRSSAGWLCTGCIAWTVRQIINGGISGVQVDEEMREKILWSVIAFLDHLSYDYWGRLHSVTLTRLGVDILKVKASLPEYLHQQIDQFLLRNYGLSYQFWHEIDKSFDSGTIELCGHLQTGREHFAHIEDQLAGNNNCLVESIRFFRNWYNRDASRYQLELLGSTGFELDTNEAKCVDRLFEENLDVSESLTRLLAFPNGRKSSPDFASVCNYAIRNYYKDVPKAPYYHVQKSVSLEIDDFLADVRDGGGDPSKLEAITRDLEILATSRSQYIGFALALALFNVLVDLGGNELAKLLAVRLVCISKWLPSADNTAGSYPPSLVNSLLALKYSQIYKPADLRNVVLHHFDLYLRNQNEPIDNSASHPDFLRRETTFYDTLVVVMSCRSYLETRVQELRKSWLGSLHALGVPYVIVVGGGKGEKIGDIIYLDCEDTYECLPQKTLSMIEWVANKTHFTYMMKIDDDCFLDADEFFHSQSYRKFDYYGRPISRKLGDTDRVWHCSKSKSMRGRLELDKSPEPSWYADGGCAYTLSRTAMLATISAFQKPEGEELVNSSFMEDKMLGDLLAMEGIYLQNEDYYVSILRRTYADAIPVSIWTNGFFPSKFTPIKLIHLDSDKTQQSALRIKDEYSLMPKKIWPSHTPPLLGYNTNALELVSEEEKLNRLNKAPLAVIACVRNEMFMLPHFLAHYRDLGVECFLIADNLSDDGTLEYLAEQPDVALFSVDTEYRLSQYGVAWQQTLLSSLRLARWSLVADADELLIFNGWENGKITDRLPQWDSQGIDGVRIFMLDMYPEKSLSAASFTSGSPFEEAYCVDRVPFLSNSSSMGAYSNAPTWTSALRHRLIRGSRTEQFVAQKIALLKYKPWMRVSAGLHYVGDVSLAEEQMIFAHFKYHSDFRSKVISEVERSQHYNNAEEYKKYLALIAEGRDMIFDPDISVHWQSCDFVKSMLGY
ncbi:MAG: hypothetical protein RLZZ505_2812 [Verrucomicrobiota bacterium]|jgi:hypothetical protein